MDYLQDPRGEHRYHQSRRPLVPQNTDEEDVDEEEDRNPIKLNIFARQAEEEEYAVEGQCER